MITKKLAEKLARDVERMSPDEKAKLRKRIHRELGPAELYRTISGLAEAARKIQQEEQLMLAFEPTGKPIN